MKKRIEKGLTVDFNPPCKKGDSIIFLKKRLSYWQKKLELTNWNIELLIVDFKKDNGYRQSGHFIANIKKQEAKILMTWDPWRGDEEYTLVHELIHILLYKYDKYSENNIKKYSKDYKILDKYFDNLEEVVHILTKIILKRD